MMLHFRQGGGDGVCQVEDAEAAVTDTRFRGVEVGERRDGIGAALDTEGDFTAGDELQSADLVHQPWVGSSLQLVQRLELVGIGYIIEQGNGRILRIDQSVAAYLGGFDLRQVFPAHHIAPRNPSILRKVSSSDTMLPLATPSHGSRPYMSPLW